MNNKTLKIIFFILLFVLIVELSTVLAATQFLGRIKHAAADETIPPEDEYFITDFTQAPTEAEEATTEQQEDIDWGIIEPMMDDNLINILLVGQDRRDGQERQRSDSMIVCSVNTETKEVSLISFLRDLYVQIPGYSNNRLNAAYAFGGFPLLTETLKTNFGIVIDGCFEVDFTGFVALIDQLDGVDIELTASEAKIVGGNTAEGNNHLNGKQALTYSRIRKIDDDFQRTNRQRKVLFAAYEKVKTCSSTEMLFAVNSALPYLTTDLSNSQILALAWNLYPLISEVEINSYQVPSEGTYTDRVISGMAVLVPNLEAIQKVLVDEYLPLSEKGEKSGGE